MTEDQPIPPKRKWIRGVDYAEFSGLSWKEINDLWPPEVRVSSEAYTILACFIPAWERFRTWYMELEGLEKRGDLGNAFWMRDLALLAWFSRVEEAKGGLAAKEYAVNQGLHQGAKGIQQRKNALIKAELVEQMPTGRAYYRVTPKGRLVLKKFIEYVEESHAWVKGYVNEGLEKNAEAFLKQMTKR